MVYPRAPPTKKRAVTEIDFEVLEIHHDALARVHSSHVVAWARLPLLCPTQRLLQFLLCRYSRGQVFFLEDEEHDCAREVEILLCDVVGRGSVVAG